jgi:hypothetical protein
MAFAHALAEGLRAAADPAWHAAILQQGSATAARYSNEHFSSDLRRFWESYLGEDKHEYLLGAG